MINLIIPGEPVAKGRPRVTRSGIAYTPAKTQGYENLVKMCYMEQADRKDKSLFEGELKAELKAYFSIPKSASKTKAAAMREGKIRPIKRPDIDNLIKSILDALNGLAYKDDSQVVCINAEKYYSNNPRVVVRINRLD